MRRMILGTVTLLALSGCADDPGAGAEPTAERTAANGDVFNDADVAFADGMIPHHADALVMVDLTMGRDLSPEFAALAEGVREAQAPEIEVMVDWLDAWGEPVPETSRDHANSHGGAHGDMADGEDLAHLESASGEQFEDMWLEMMIEHHEGAIEMAATEQEEGAFSDALALAEQIESAQRAEIEQMEQMLAE